MCHRRPRPALACGYPPCGPTAFSGRERAAVEMRGIDGVDRLLQTGPVDQHPGSGRKKAARLSPNFLTRSVRARRLEPEARSLALGPSLKSLLAIAGVWVGDAFSRTQPGGARTKTLSVDSRRGRERKEIEEITSPWHFRLSHTVGLAVRPRACCSITGVPEPAEMGVTKCVWCCRRMGRTGTSNRCRVGAGGLAHAPSRFSISWNR
jgi:hypothetical protein